MNTAKVAIIGFGTIGSGVARLLLEQHERISRQAGRRVELVRVVDPDIGRPRNVQLPPGMLTADVNQVLSDPEITAVVQLIGGLEPDRSIMLRVLESGKDVITANKALLAEHGAELFDRARQLGRCIAFEAAVAGGVPIIAAINESLTANQIQSIHAILNGTSNFILTQMDEHGTGYKAAVAEAQRRGYAEANPTLDVDGSDAAQKLAILAHLAFGARVAWRDIPRAGIATVQVADMRYAKELGYAIKLLAVAELGSDGLELYVTPTLVRRGSLLAEVRGAYNAIRVVGDAVGHVFFQGLGAGQMPTASAVVADLINTLLGRTAITFRASGLWSDARKAVSAAREPAKIPGRFYLRLNADDKPGVMAELTGVLARHEISIASVIQHETEEEENRGTVPVVIMTHVAAEGAMAAAIEAFDKLHCVRSGIVRMRVEK